MTRISNNYIKMSHVVSSDIQVLVNQAQAADKSIREAAEQSLLSWCDEDANGAFGNLMSLASNPTSDLSSRQFALLALRKFITMFWSPGFESYRTCSNLNEDTKNYIRDSTLGLALNKMENSKIKSSASYCIVQISAVDFPDLWPSLLITLYHAVLEEHSLEALSILNDIYDDIISEEMFFEEGIGMETMRVIFGILDDTTSSVETKISAAKLFYPCLMQMSIVGPNASKKRIELVMSSITEITKKWEQFLQSPLQGALNDKPEELSLEWRFRGTIFEGLAFIHANFSKKLLPSQYLTTFKKYTLNDLVPASNIYMSMITSNITIDESSFSALNSYVTHNFEFLTNISKIKYTEEELSLLAQAVVKLCCFDLNAQGTLLSDFNDFTSKETGLSPSFTVRDQIAEFLVSLSHKNYEIMFTEILSILNNFFCSVSDINNEWRQLESIFFGIQSLLLSEEEVSGQLSNASENLLSAIASKFEEFLHIPLLFSRMILVIPKILEKFMDSITNIKTITSEFLKQTLTLAARSDDELIKSAALISFNGYSSFAELRSVLNDELCDEVQQLTLYVIGQIINDAEEDTFGLLMEALNNLIDCNSSTDKLGDIAKREFNLILTITSKDPSNVQMTVESQDCLEKLLSDIDTHTYCHYIEVCFPSLIKVVVGSAPTEYKYTPLLSLALEFISIFMKKKPLDGYLPNSICRYIFNPLKDILLNSKEDETLQLATEAFSYLIHNTEQLEMQPNLSDILSILSRLLSIDVSDSAAMNVGPLIITILTLFPEQVNTYIPQILSSASERFIKAKNISTSQNLLALFCFLVYSEPQQTVDFLSSINLTDDENKTGNGLQLVLRKWLKCFEIIRGDQRIKENIVALNKLYYLNDEKIKRVEVDDELIPYDGDIIITRSMSKKLPDKYTQAPFYNKVIKLFIQELLEQSKQPDPNKYMDNNMLNLNELGENNSTNANANEEEDEEDAWEDVDDVLDYEKLQEYVDDDDEDFDDGGEHDDITGLHQITVSERDLLVNFFKDITANNVTEFQNIYSTLSDDEKATLSMNLV